jgi:hypothetical protein
MVYDFGIIWYNLNVLGFKWYDLRLRFEGLGFKVCSSRIILVQFRCSKA